MIDFFFFFLYQSSLTNFMHFYKVFELITSEIVFFYWFDKFYYMKNRIVYIFWTKWNLQCIYDTFSEVDCALRTILSDLKNPLSSVYSPLDSFRTTCHQFPIHPFGSCYSRIQSTFNAILSCPQQPSGTIRKRIRSTIWWRWWWFCLWIILSCIFGQTCR